MPKPRPTKNLKSQLLLFAVLALAAGLRLWQLNARGLWFDEAFEYWSASVPLRDLLSVTAASYQPPLYGIVLHFWLLISHSETWMRLLSVLLDLIGILAILLLIRRAFSTRSSVFVGLILALSPALIRYAQEAAEYSLVFALLAWMCFLAFLCLKQGKWANWLGFGALAGLAFLSHYGAIILIAATFLCLGAYLIMNRPRKTMPGFMVAGGLFLAFCLPILGLLFQQAGQVQASSAFTTATPVTLIRDFIKAYSDGFAFLITGYPYSQIPKWYIRLLLLVAAVLGIWTVWKAGKRERIIFGWFSLSFLIYFVLTYSGRYGHGGFGFRYILVLMPAFALFLAVVLERLSSAGPRWLANSLLIGLVGVLLVFEILSLPNRSVSEMWRGSRGWPEVELTRETYDAWQENRSGDEVTYVYYGAIPAFEYYLRTEEKDAAASELPTGWINNCWSGKTPELCADNQIVRGRWMRGADAQRWLTEIKRTGTGSRARVWAVADHVYPGDLDSMKAAFEQLGYSQTVIPGVITNLMLFER